MFLWPASKPISGTMSDEMCVLEEQGGDDQKLAVIQFLATLMDQVVVEAVNRADGKED